MTASAKPGFAPTKETYIAGFTLVAIALHVALKYALHFPALTYNLPLFVALFVGGIPMVWQLLKKLVKRQFGSDLLAGVSIITAILLGEYLVATIVVLMLSGGEALEEFATARASSVLDALARRMPSVAHRKDAGSLVDVKLSDIRIGENRRTVSEIFETPEIAAFEWGDPILVVADLDKVQTLHRYALGIKVSDAF